MNTNPNHNLLLSQEFKAALAFDEYIQEIDNFILTLEDPSDPRFDLEWASRVRCMLEEFISSSPTTGVTP